MQLEVRQLRQAMESRGTIDQARGMIMAWQACSSEAAWQVLVEVSQRTNTKLRDVAAGLVSSSTGDPLPADHRRQLTAAVHRVNAVGD